METSKFLKKVLIFGISTLIIISSVIQITMGYTVKPLNRNILIWDNFDCYNLSEISNDKFHIFREYSNNDTSSTEVNAGISSMITDDLMDSPWPMKCHDLRHTSRSPYSTANNTGLEKWRVRSIWDGTVESSAVIGDDGTIYFGTMGTDCRLYALYPDGTIKWYYPVGLMIWATPAIAEDGTIYVTSWDDYLHAVYSNGTRKWRFNLRGDSSCSPAIGNDGTIYCGSTSSYIYAINPNGTEKWRYLTGDWTMSNPAISKNGTIYMGSFDKYLYALNPNGTLQWRFKTGGYIKGHPSIADDGTIYVPSFDDYLYALYPNGTIKWKVNTNYSAASAAIAEDGTIYVATDKLRAIYPTNGTIKWSVDIGGNVGPSSPAISSEGTIYISNDKGKSLVAVYPNGSIKWQKLISNLYARSSPIIDEDGTIYVGSSWNNDNGYSFGYLHAFGPVESNNPPDKPVISGGKYGNVRTEYRYTFVATDPNNNPIYYCINWGDGNNEETRECASGEQIKLKHKYLIRGTYTIKAKAIDTLGEESDWAYLEVTMPKNKDFNNNFNILERLFERFPNTFPIFRHLLGYR